MQGLTLKSAADLPLFRLVGENKNIVAIGIDEGDMVDGG